MSYDITFCVNKTCRHAAKCRRSTLNLVIPQDMAKFNHTSYAEFQPDPNTGKCEYFWPNVLLFTNTGRKKGRNIEK